MIAYFWNWLTTSSADPEKTALTVKGILVGIIPVAISLAPTLCGLHLVCLGSDEVSNIINMLAQIALALGAAASSIMIVVGLIRKAIKGQWSAY